MHAWLVLPSGARVRVGTSGVQIGRHPESDVVCLHPEVSRHHGHVHVTPDGLAYAPLGRGVTLINGRVADGPTPLEHGDRISIPGCDIKISIESSADDDTPSGWMLESDSESYGVTRFPFCIGGSAEDHLNVPDWPPGAARFSLSADGLSAQLNGVRLNADELEPGSIVEIFDGDRLSSGESTFTLRRLDAQARGTTRVPLAQGPVKAVRLEFLPRGGTLTVTFGDRALQVQLMDLRCDLASALLKPPAPLVAGDFVPDDLLQKRVWGANSKKTRGDLTLLVHRLRHDLIGAGMNGMSLIERLRGSGATRFRLEPDAEVVVV